MIADRGLVRSRASAAEAIRAGRVRIGRGGQRVAKPSELIDPGVELSLDPGRDYASRAGVKLENGLDALGIDVAGRDCLDVGASTGGFTDCLLKRGAARVIALDVAQGQLDWALRNDDRVHVIERMNARDLRPEDLPYAPSLATVDVSFISLVKVLPAVAASLGPGGEVLGLVKPQFELGRKRVRGGVVRDAADRREALGAVAAAAVELGLAIRGFAASGLPGPKGNLETFIWLATPPNDGESPTMGGDPSLGEAGPEGLDPAAVEAAIGEVDP